MPKPRHHRVRRRASVRVDTESPHSNNESDTVSPEVNWGKSQPLSKFRGRRRSMGKSKRRSTKPRPGYHISQSDDDEDEIVFTPVQRRRKARDVDNEEATRRIYQEPQVHPEDSYSIRRSTRQRKLKYDNYNDSWIVGSQTVKGYPCYVNTSLSRRERLRRQVVKALPNLSPAMEDEEEEIEDADDREDDDIVKEEPARRIQRRTTSKDEMRLGLRTRRPPPRPQVESSEEDMDLDESKEEPPRKRVRRVGKRGRRPLRERVSQRMEEDDEEEEESSDEREDLKEVHRARSGRRARPPQRYEPDLDSGRKLPVRRMPCRKKQQVTPVKQEQEEERPQQQHDEDQPVAEDVKPKVEKSDDEDSDSSSVTSQNKDPTSGQDQSFQDMYARVKQRRRNNTTRTPITGSGEDSMLPQHANKSDSESSSGGMSERVVNRRIRRPSQNRKTYHLRQVKPAVNRFQVSQPKIREVLDVVRRKRPSRRRRWSSSSSDSSDDRYDRKKSKAKSSKSMALAGTHGTTNKPETTGLLADVDPLALDTSIRFSNVGGLESHIDCLKEMVVFPMLYKEIFEKFNVTPPKGVLFHGPPGTGKTLMARALANECSQGSRKVSFFMRKGADCLSKWVGESERQLRLLFEEAKQARPSIIFFDELDGLAPVRSAKQDQIHASIVCTLLALMDGLDNRGDIIVIGATNRIDSIDPALRRPGRFDRELYFPLPGLKERREILGIHTKGWSDEATLNKMSEESWGYCGSDLKALCSEAILQAMKRIFPQIYLSSHKLKLDPNKVKVDRLDFMRAKRGIVPASKRGVCCMSRRLPKYLEPLLNNPLHRIYSYLCSVFPHNGTSHRDKVVRNPRLMLKGEKAAVMCLAGALLHKLEHCCVLSISLEAIHSEATVSPEEAISRVFKEVPQRPGAVLWMGDIALWWDSLSDLSRNVFLAHIDSLDATLPVLFLAVSTSKHIPSRMKKIFSEFHGEIQILEKPTEQQKRDFFTPLLKEKAVKPPIVKKKPDELEVLPAAPPSPPRPLTKGEEDKVYFEEENTLRELRIFLRQICAKLARNKQFYMFSKPVDINEVPDYLNIINEPMDLESMMTKIDLHKYTCAQDFLNDIDLLCRNALEYNPDKDPEDKLIRHRACYLRDTAYALIKAEMDSDFEITCRSIRDKRKDRGNECGTARFVREFFPDHLMEEDGVQPGGNRSPANPHSANTSAPNTPNHQGDEGNSGGGSGGLNSESKKRKRRLTSSWAKGLIKKKKTPLSTPTSGQTNTSGLNHMCEGDESGEESTAVPAVHSTPLKTPVKKCKLDSEGVEGVAEAEERVCVTVMANGEVSSGSSDIAEPITKKPQDESMALTEHSFHTESNNSGGEKQLIVDETGLDQVLKEVISLSLLINSYKALIDLYVALERIVHPYLRKWDRSQLVKDLRDVIHKYSEEYRQPEEESCSDEDNENTDLVAEDTKQQVSTKVYKKSPGVLSKLRSTDNVIQGVRGRTGSTSI